MDCASFCLKRDDSDLGSLSDGNESEGGKLSALVLLVIAIDLENTEIAVEESENAAADPQD